MGMYYTTSEVMGLFGWQSKTTIDRKIKAKFLPPPDLPGRPNKWRKCKIDAIIDAPNSGDIAANNDPI